MSDTGDKMETEIKLWVTEFGSLEQTLLAQGAILSAPRVFERNVRYDLPNGSLARRGMVLRLRQDSRVRLTYKEGGSSKDGVISRFEAEVEVSDFKTMDEILTLLGYMHSMAYEKYRTTYQMDGCEVVLDELPFGKFVEIEGKHESILALMKRLNLTEALRVEMSYVRAFEVIAKKMGLTFRDATFENFAAIHVPEIARDWLAS